MLFPPTLTAILPKLPLENMEEFGLERLSWITGYDTEKHEWITSDGLDCDASAYDQDAWSKLVKDPQTKVRTGATLLISSNPYWIHVGCSPGGPQSEQVRQGMGRRERARGPLFVRSATCSGVRCLTFGRMTSLSPGNVRPWAARVASLAIRWNAVVVVDRGDYFMKSPYPEHRERINVMIQEFESPECMCLWPSVLTDKQTLLRPFSATINFPDLDPAARRQRWLQLFSRDDLAAALSSAGVHPLLLGTQRSGHLFERLRKSLGADMEDFMILARSSAGGHDPTPQHVKAFLKDWGAPLSVRSKVARFFALR
ncbi:hypothetical protein EDD22DRAFT_956747 [Suillus occidentalis]|nr:hypothetical protein EDD22DRAFT_956747 [Suillus occidentalis]